MQIDFVKLPLEVITGSSVLHTFLPPWEIFSDYPGFQRKYKLFIYIVGYMALNGRSTVYRSVSTKDGSQPSDASQKQNSNGG